MIPSLVPSLANLLDPEAQVRAEIIRSLSVEVARESLDTQAAMLLIAQNGTIELEPLTGGWFRCSITAKVIDRKWTLSGLVEFRSGRPVFRPGFTLESGDSKPYRSPRNELVR